MISGIAGQLIIALISDLADKTRTWIVRTRAEAEKSHRLLRVTKDTAVISRLRIIFVTTFCAAAATTAVDEEEEHGEEVARRVLQFVSTGGFYAGEYLLRWLQRIIKFFAALDVTSRDLTFQFIRLNN